VRNLLYKIKGGQYVMSTYFSADARDLISRMLTTDPKKRIKVMIWLKVQCMLDIVTDLSEK
jgi:hypothetical protein